jgi:hypothetical protein
MAQARRAAEDHDPMGATMQWDVHAQYAITQGMLVGQGPHKVWYAPMEYPQLVTALAQLRAGDEKAVLRFARQYGPLGYDRLMPDTGEPLAWIWAHAVIIRVCLRLTTLLTPGSEAALEDYVRRVDWDAPDGVPFRFDAPSPSFPEAEAYTVIQRYQKTYEDAGLAYNQRLYYNAGLNSFHPDKDALAVLDKLGTAAEWARLPEGPGLNAGPLPSLRSRARKIRCYLINQWMGPIERQLWDQEGVPPRSCYGLGALYNYAYWHLADFAEDRYVRVQRCAACGALFVRTDNRQRFCPPGPRQKGSRCAARERMRAKRRRAT